MDVNERIALRNHVVLEKFSDGGLVLDPLTGGLFELNRTGLRIVQLLERGRTAGEIALALAEGSDACKGQIETDVLSLLSDLSKRGLLMSEETSGQERADENSPITVSEEDVVIQDRDAVVAEVDRGCALLYRMTGCATSTVLNTTAFWLWERCEQPVSVNNLSRLLLDEYDDVTKEEALEDVRSFVEQMLQGGFLIRRESGV